MIESSQSQSKGHIEPQDSREQHSGWATPYAPALGRQIILSQDLPIKPFQ